MKYSNRHHLPERVIRVIEGKYKQNKRPKPNRLSITDLINDPLPRILYIHHWDDIIVDYSDFLTMTQGNALHERYEMYPVDSDDDVEHKIEEAVQVMIDDVEHKIEDAVQGMIVVGKADNKRDNSIIDVKQTGVYGPKYRIPKWTKQLNSYSWMWRKRGEEIAELIIDVWYRDWKEGNKHWRDYPPIPYETILLDLWDFSTQEKYIRKQVQKHANHPVYENLLDYTQPCSDEQRGIRWEAYKNSGGKLNKNPTKIGASFAEVNAWALSQKDKFEIKQSQPIFCIRYCKSRSVCPFAQGLA